MLTNPLPPLTRAGSNCVETETTYKSTSKLDDAHSMKWAPLFYFLPTLAMTSVGLSNKMGIWDMPLDHAVVAVVDYAQGKIKAGLKSLMDNDSLTNFDRIVMKHKARMVGATVLYKSWMYMCNSNSVEVSPPRGLNVYPPRLSAPDKCCAECDAQDHQISFLERPGHVAGPRAV